MPRDLQLGGFHQLEVGVEALTGDRGVAQVQTRADHDPDRLARLVGDRTAVAREQGGLEQAGLAVVDARGPPEAAHLGAGLHAVVEADEGEVLGICLRRRRPRAPSSFSKVTSPLSCWPTGEVARMQCPAVPMERSPSRSVTMKFKVQAPPRRTALGGGDRLTGVEETWPAALRPVAVCSRALQRRWWGR